MSATQVIAGDAPDAVDAAQAVLDKGGMVAFPTDTVYGLAADAWNSEAILRLFELKRRSRDKAIPILIAEMKSLNAVAQTPGEKARRLAHRFWPGPLTIVVERHQELPSEIGPADTVGVRMPDHALALNVLRGRPLAVTSANLSSEPEATSADQVLASLSPELDLLIDGGTTPGGVPSTVVDCSSGELTVLRSGPISEGQIRAALA